MSGVWQNMAVGGIVVVALTYVAWRVWRLVTSKRPTAHCVCSECPAWWEEGPADTTDLPCTRKEPDR